MKLSDQLKLVPRAVRRLVVTVIGGTVLLTGIVMIVAPGPATLVIPAGLAILSVEFVWARRLLSRYKSAASKAVGVFRSNPKPRPPAPG